VADFDATEFCPPRYAVVRQIAHGPRTHVFEAVSTDPRLQDRRVALKVLSWNEYREWFLRMARVTACLCHPRIVACHEVSEIQDRIYIVLDFVPGTDLRDEIWRGTQLSVMDVVRIVREVSEALDCAHARRVIHGNLHPKHILLTADRQPRLIGFGEYPPPDHLIGNPIHLAPEQLLECAQATPQTDVYSLSESVFWTLSGTHPYKTQNSMQLLEAKKTGPSQTLRELRPDLSSRIDAVLRKGMAPKPKDRFQSARELAESLAESNG
jgi:serine/threonine-protein kinase